MIATMPDKYMTVVHLAEEEHRLLRIRLVGVSVDDTPKGRGALTA